MPSPIPGTGNTPHYTNCIWEPLPAVPYDEIVDVRSPKEFAVDHIPGAVNLPVLNDAEHAEVGTLYQQINPFVARKRGAALVSANIARHLTQHFAEKPKSYRPFLYCWRGGQRSLSMAVVLSQVGWRVTVLEGGYRTYRNTVPQRLAELPGRFQYRVVSGATGCAKTRFLHALRQAGCQVLDLEGLAVHRGSILGGMGPQPSQKWWESQLVYTFGQWDPTRPVWVEAESRRIGNLYLPPALWAAMRQASGVVLRVPQAARVQYLLEEYATLCSDEEGLRSKLRALQGHHSLTRIQEWCQLATMGAWESLVESLLVNHYDPAYQQSTQRNYPQVTRAIDLPEASSTALEELAQQFFAEEHGHGVSQSDSATLCRWDHLQPTPAR
ncbi:MAG: tRNA 2-selenouridine(34) synthase MnmH [Bacteroidales bacterium]|nr:tRNA 2-selenouridine(34) synthase MnmH [Bacteroidales bacterium]